MIVNPDVNGYTNPEITGKHSKKCVKRKNNNLPKTKRIHQNNVG